MLRSKQREGTRYARRTPPDPSAGNPLHAWAQRFCEWTVTVGLSPATAKMRQIGLQYFIAWLDARGVCHPGEVTRPVLQRYQRALYLARKKNGEPLAYTSQATRLYPVMAFFKWLTREGHILSNPAADLDVPKPARQLPKHLMSITEVESVINGTPVHTVQGIRDRAMLEVLYSSGVRRGELMRLKLCHVDTARGTLMVRQGKGRKDRLVPLGERACLWLGRYLREVRPELIGVDTEVLFLTDYGESFEKNRLSDLVKGYMLAAGIAHGNCHAFRHAMATHMLEAGADIRYIQVILGHSQLSTTEIYTHVAITQLQAVHALTHPAKLHRVATPAPSAQAGPSTGQEGVNMATDDPRPQPDAKSAAIALLADLAAENDESDDI
jgi:integrase/recombinase XerD